MSQQPRALAGAALSPRLSEHSPVTAIPWVGAGRGKDCHRSDLIQRPPTPNADAFTNYATGVVTQQVHSSSPHETHFMLRKHSRMLQLALRLIKAISRDWWSESKKE